jgi:ATP adenylyltransferase
MNPDGYNVGINLGRTAGAGIPGHVHYHVVPRWDGDYNFMPIIAETKVMPQHLLRTYDQLAPLFQEAEQRERPWKGVQQRRAHQGGSTGQE